MKDDKENDIEMNDGDSTESPADGNNMHANPESEKKPHNRKVIAAICGLALVALIGLLWHRPPNRCRFQGRIRAGE